jgi:MFS family permease
MQMPKGYWTIWTATLLFFAAFYTLMIPLPLYLTDIGLPDWQVGVILGALGIASLVARPLAGAGADSRGRQPVMLFGTGALLLGAVGMSFMTQPLLLFGLRVSQALGYVAFTTAATALISDLAPSQRRGKALAYFGTAANVAMTLTPAAVNAALGVLTLKGAFWLSGILAMIGGILALQVRQETRREKQAFDWRDLLRVLNRLRTPMVTSVFFGLGFGAFLQFLPLLAERRALGAAGLAYTVYGIGIIATRLTTGRLLDGSQRGRIMPVAFVLLSMGLGVFALAGSQTQLLMAAVIVAVGAGILHPLLIAVHVERVPSIERGRASAVFYLGFDLGIGLGAWVLSPAFQWLRLTGLYLIAAIMAFVGVLPARLTMSAEPGLSPGTAMTAEEAGHS